MRGSATGPQQIPRTNQVSDWIAALLDEFARDIRDIPLSPTDENIATSA